MSAPSHPGSSPVPRDRLALTCLAALGVVFGDIGTSPLYAFRACFADQNGIAASRGNVLGILSLIFWALMIVISVKYLLYVMRADNEGEGGILALMALIRQRGSSARWIMAAGIFGAALLYGDGMITPAISVLSAVEGLEIASPVFEPFTVPITVAILVALFAFQSRGSERIGLVFGPVTLVWFLVIGTLGAAAILKEPSVLGALNPWHAVAFFRENGWLGATVLGAVFLVVTGGEALYADLGHFGLRPIRLTWFAIVLPALALNYFGQGALVLGNPSEIASPFYHLAPRWALLPLVGLSTCATIVASQAVISGAFSLSRQAVHLGELPRLKIRQTSSAEIGQIYVPVVNWTLLLATIGLVIGFGSSDRLSAAYGIAVSTTMLITTVLAGFVAKGRWRWNALAVALTTAVFLPLDLAFFGANILKFPDGGWFPVLVGTVFFVLMTSWRRGHDLLGARLRKQALPIEKFIESFAADPPVRVSGTSIFFGGSARGTPPALLHHLKCIQALNERVILLNVSILKVPHVIPGERIACEDLGHGFLRVVLSFGFMDVPDVPTALEACEPAIELRAVTYYFGKRTLLVGRRMRGMAQWRKRIFAFMARNSEEPMHFFNVPPRQTVEIGVPMEI